MERRLIYLLQVPTWVYKLKVGLQHYDRLVDKARILVSHYRSKAGAGVQCIYRLGRVFDTIKTVGDKVVDGKLAKK